VDVIIVVCVVWMVF